MINSGDDALERIKGILQSENALIMISVDREEGSVEVYTRYIDGHHELLFLLSEARQMLVQIMNNKKALEN